ncbi:type VII secretion target [Actinoplanes sp. CA-030573]|uniref:type VII secretion target n=1 Tax=Actinoplanes sp. CA-030573 TaxID=3239898 RepID=UPI003D915448
MAEGFKVVSEQLRSHAARVEQLSGEFGAVKAASGFITGDAAAYGLLCGWISDILEGRHRRQDELVAYAEENLTLLADALRKTAEEYDQIDKSIADTLRAAGAL